MRIAVNTRLLLKGKLEGIGWFTYQTLKRMVENHPEHEFIFIFDRPYDPSFIFGKNVTAVVVGPPARHPILFYLWLDWSVAYVLKKYKADVANLQKEYPDFETFIKKKEKYCSEIAKTMIFDKHLLKINNDKNGLRPITSFFKK